MKIIVTADEAITYRFWDKLCDLKGINVWAVSEGLMDGDHEITLTVEEAQKLGVDWYVMRQSFKEAADKAK